MTDITKNQTDITPSAPRKLMSLKERLGIESGPRQTITDFVLVDISGSMECSANADQTRWQVCQGVIRKADYTNLFAFATKCERVENGKLPDSYGGTDLTKALHHVRAQKGFDGHIVLLTDGHPDDAKTALDAARGMKIDIVYIGPAPTPRFLEDLANVTNGKFIPLSLAGPNAQAQLGAVISGLLGA